MSKKVIYIVLVIALLSISWSPVVGAESAEEYMIPQRLIDCPTAGIGLEKRAYFYLRMYEQGGVLVAINTGISRDVSMGLSLSGTNVIGSDEVDAHIGIQVKYMFLEEDKKQGWPALTLGLDTQGYGPYYDTYNRYKYKSKGLYVVASKNYTINPDDRLYLSNLGLHAGINYSFETDDESNGLDLFVGLDKMLIEPALEFIAEYSLALNDDLEDGMFGEPENQGYFNLGLRWSPFRTLNLEFMIKNLNKNNVDDPIRIFALTFRTNQRLKIE